jgi:hypothetical protein
VEPAGIEPVADRLNYLTLLTFIARETFLQ